MVSRLPELGQPQVRSPAVTPPQWPGRRIQPIRIPPSTKHPKVTFDTKYPIVWKVLLQLIIIVVPCYCDPDFLIL